MFLGLIGIKFNMRSSTAYGHKSCTIKKAHYDIKGDQEQRIGQIGAKTREE